MARSANHRPYISARAAALRGNSLVDLFLLARERGAIDLALGTPGYPDPDPEIIDAAREAMSAGHNQYSLPAGELLLRQQIAATVLRAPTDPETELTVTVGATEALCVALLTVVEPGDEVVLLDPGFEQFQAAITLAGALPRFVPLYPPDWRFDPADLAAAFSSRTRAVLLNSPGNPTGRVLDRTELDQIAELAERWDTTVICDEVYSNFVFDGRAMTSIAEVPGLAERSIVVGSLSKSYAISGWRLGFLRADAARTQAMRRVHELTTCGTAAPLQVAVGLAALSADLTAAGHGMGRRRDLAVEIFTGMGMKITPAEGGCFLLADVSPLTAGRRDSKDFVLEFLDATGVLVVPGGPSFSDPSRGAQYVRIAFNRQFELLQEVERRVRAAGLVAPPQHTADQLGPLPGFMQPGPEGVARVVTPTGDDMWLVRGYALGRAVLTDKRFSRVAALAPDAPKFNDVQPAADSMMSMDGAPHTRLRRLVSGAFTTGRIAKMRTFIEELTDRHLDTIARLGHGADLIENLARPLPLAVLCRMLGVPEQDSGEFGGWVDVLFDIDASSPRDKARSRIKLIDYVTELLEHKRRDPQEDLLSDLLAVHDRGELSTNELLTLGLTLLMAGYETTAGQIGLATLSLLADRAVLDELIEHPDRIGNAVEELIRLNPSSPLAFPRIATEPVQVGDITVQPGEGVMVALLHGNRDTDVFTDPETMHIASGRSSSHLTFGHGEHRCLGAPLATLQVRIVLERLLRRFPAMRFADVDTPFSWTDGMATRSLAQLRVAW
ncbi:aminotransferase class I/II-fold pyridoxal phosphate-dependent enzyme [Amycolatopsis sp. cmx-4-68]|uniref:aminotransferase class I/II-fold pyridoxal phosphate-dependent enzyme n=1 Tax=Amycolatopsis sp. cmx-4-68 TaxID=2790938 RepID=UPI0039795A03